nr:MAG TPA: deaminase [Caudoviricetes sp.]
MTKARKKRYGYYSTTINGLLVTIRYIGLSKASCLMTYDYSATILLEKLRLLVTTIPAGTLRLLLALIGYRAKARKEIRR